MNKSNISKLNLFFMGLRNRFNENIEIFKHINFEFTSGLKNFKGTASLEESKLKFNFNGITKKSNIDEFFKYLIDECSNYEGFSLTYSERGEVLLITADNKNVAMKTIDTNNDLSASPTASNNKVKKDITPAATTSTLLNRDYYIKAGEADAMLKEIGIMSKDGKIKNDKIRKYNQIDHYVELLEDILDDLPRNQVINILDCGCGKSYLSFVLNHYLTDVKKYKCHFIGLDHSETVIESSRAMASNLGYRNMEFHAVDINEYKPSKHINVVISLHACDTATDMALALGIKVEADIIIAVPCCHREMLSQYSYAPFKSILDQGIFKARMADILTDGMRTLMLKAKGYKVSVVEYISPLETPKNLMIRAIKETDEDLDAMTEYMSLMSSLNVYPALYDYLNQWE
ncbi:MAG: SAM-dependent methyltransferase [Clostridium sp.]|nr:SAM-dependent methyltransferase [Clostridium sp.]MDU7086040.1 SAM-dependent methyltransferase [Clostridium sp.]